MGTYADIVDAFAESCKTGIELRTNAYAVAKHLTEIFREKANMGARLHPHPSSKDANLESTYTPAGATEYNPEKHLWEIGFILDVRQGTNIFPSELLRFTVTFKQTGTEGQIGLAGSDISVAFQVNESPETLAALESFCSVAADAIAQHYRNQSALWLKGGDSDQRVIGFSNA
jgi:hypothetical protein